MSLYDPNAHGGQANSAQGVAMALAGLLHSHVSHPSLSGTEPYKQGANPQFRSGQLPPLPLPLPASENRIQKFVGHNCRSCIVIRITDVVDIALWYSGTAPNKNCEYIDSVKGRLSKY